MLGGEQIALFQDAETSLAQLSALNQRNVQQVTAEAERKTRLARDMVIGVSVVALTVPLLLAALISRSILRQMGGDPARAKAIVGRIAAGDLSQPIPLRNGNDGSLLASMAHMQAELRSLIGRVLEDSRQLAAAAAAVSSDVTRLGDNGQEERHAAEETARVVAAIAEHLEQVGRSALSARDLSLEAGRLSDTGQNFINQARNEMTHSADAVQQSSGVIEQMGGHSQQIAEIVNVIKDIAGQTNLLALNAAIEAARPEALVWALERGSRSGRVAYQFARDYAGKQ